ncbi:MAG: mechanosensitive ion channel family protein [Candidatus Adiutrix sp.]|jgi:small conductance mechanosensitive channel|nr:mechanosensitive ion channel family protein [Candidatus Adiutrix sp.]
MIFAAFSLLGPLTAGTARAEGEAAPAGAPDIQKAIALLEDEASRQEMITLLKLLAALDREKAGAVIAELESGRTLAEDEDGVKNFLSALTEEAWEGASVSGRGLKQSARVMTNVFKALAMPEALDMWLPYLLKIFLWGLACLLGTFFIIKKYGQMPEASGSAGARFRAAARHILLVTGPNLALILSFLSIPPLSTTARGVTADLATGFSFLYVFIRHFFISLSMLYITLEIIKILFTPGPGRRPLANVHPVLARHFAHTLRLFTVYTTFMVFFKDAFMGHFLASSLYLGPLIFLTLPVPAYLTARLVKLRRLVCRIGEAEVTAPPEEQPGPDEEAAPESVPPRLEYQADMLIKKHWGLLSFIAVWTLWFLSLLNPADTSRRFAGQLLFCVVMLGLAVLGIKFLRRLLGRLAARDTGGSRSFLLYADLLICAVIGLAWGGLVVTVWGVPLEGLLDNGILRDIAGRALAIAAVIVGLAVFVRFSQLTTDWLMSSPDLARNRNWRTMTPLALTAVRALAVFTGVVAILERLGVNVGPILAGAGILGLGVGMGAQSLVKDVINGISILTMDTLSVGDYVTIGGKSGTVETVGLRSIRLRDAAGNLTVVPNSIIDTIVNMTRDYSQDLVEFAVPYDADPDAMLDMARDVAAELSRDSAWRACLTAPVSVQGITAFDAGGTTIRLKISTAAGEQWAVGRELRLRLKRRMLQDGLTASWFGQNVIYHHKTKSEG